jgi:hypothetical protein
MSYKFDQHTIQKALDWAYDTAVNGIPGASFAGLGTAEGLAASYLKRQGALSDNVNSLIFWHTTTAATTGFVTGLGGILTLPVALPANIAVVLLTQLRMIAAIAHMGGYNIRDDQVRALCYVCLCGSSAGDILKSVGIQAGTKVGQRAIERLPFAVIKQINQAVGFRLITKFGSTGVINLGKALPLIGGRCWWHVRWCWNPHHWQGRQKNIYWIISTNSSLHNLAIE